MKAAVALVLAASLGLTPPVHAEPVLYVFLPIGLKPAALEKQLRAALPGVQVTVFGRINDLRSTVQSTPPTAVLCDRDVLVSLELEPEYQGLKGGSAAHRWLLVSTGAVDAGQLSGKTIGVVDLLGRKKLPAFVASLVGVSEVKVQTVTKVEDLLPLLQFQAVDAVLVPEESYAELRSRTQMDLRELRIDSARVGRAALAFVRSDGREHVEKALLPLSPAVAALTGVDAWSSKK